MFVDEKGNVIAHVSDFNRQRYGGFELAESQSVRARDALDMAVCAAYASPKLVRGIDRMDAGRIVQSLVQNHGCTVHVIVVGGKA